MRTARFANAVDERGDPIIAATRRWDISDLDEWLLMRLNFRWQFPENTWRGKLTLFSNNNDFYFVTNHEATLLAMTLCDPVSGDPFVMERFAFARSADYKDGVWGLPERTGVGDAALRALYRQMRDWAHDKRAARVYGGTCSDMVPSALKETLGGYFLVGAKC